LTDNTNKQNVSVFLFLVSGNRHYIISVNNVNTPYVTNMRRCTFPDTMRKKRYWKICFSLQLSPDTVSL